MTKDQRYEYANQVWDEFILRIQKPLQQISPSEWWLLVKWMDAGIPLRVVLRAFDDTKWERAKTLRYFDLPVREAFRYWLKAMND